MRVSYLAGLALPALTLAQTSTTCNPTKKSCPSDKGLTQSTYNVDFTKGADSAFKMTYGDAKYDSNGLSFTITKPGEAPTMQSDFYFFFGTISAVAKAAPGTGIVSCVILESDDLDEIDWEWLGGDNTQVQTDYFGKGNTTTYTRGGFAAVNNAQDDWHNYTIQWTPEYTTWYVDGSAVRTLNFADAVGGTNYPQTPMRIKLGIWSASDTHAPGTIAWAGGNTDYSQAPFTMYLKSLSITNDHPAAAYSYGDMSGDWQSIKMDSKAPSSDTSSADSSGITGGGELITPDNENASSSSSASKSSATTMETASAKSGKKSSATATTATGEAKHTETPIAAASGSSSSAESSQESAKAVASSTSSTGHGLLTDGRLQLSIFSACIFLLAV